MPAESVHAVFEVKPTVSKQWIRDAAAKAATVRVPRPIDLARPRHRAMIDLHALEKRSVAQRSEHAGEFGGRELHPAASPIREVHE